MGCPLTERERLVLQCYADGLSIRETAVTLGFSRPTAGAHRSNIKKKLDVRSMEAALAVVGWSREPDDGPLPVAWREYLARFDARLRAA